MSQRTFLKRLICAILLGTAVEPSGMVMAKADEELSMLLRRATRAETISSEIALRLAEMVFARHYGEATLAAQLPLVITDRADKWEINGSQAAPLGQRLRMIIMKTDGRIVDLVSR